MKLKYSHRCFEIKKEQSGLKTLGREYFLKIEYYSSQGIWCLNVKNHPSIIISNCPFCGLKLPTE